MNGVQALIDGLAEQIGQPVGVDDRRFRAVAYSSHADEIDPVRRASILGRQAPEQVTDWLEDLGVGRATGHMRVPANPDLSMAPRVCFPLRVHNRLLGYLWLVEDNGPLDEELVLQIEQYTGEIAQELFRLEESEHEDHRREADEVGRLTKMAAGDDDGSHTPLLASAAWYAVAEVDAGGAALDREADIRLAAAVGRARRSAAPRHLLALAQDGRATAVLAGASKAELERTASMLLGCAAGELEDLDHAVATVGLGGPRASKDELPAAWREAQLAARVARSAAPHGPLAVWDALEAYRLVAELSEGRDPAALVPAMLSLLIADADAEVLMHTVEAYLEHGGDAAAAASELFIHRSSLYNRLHRVEELTGVSMRAGEARLEMHLGLRLWRLTQPSGASTGVEKPAVKTRQDPNPGGGPRP